MHCNHTDCLQNSLTATLREDVSPPATNAVINIQAPEEDFVGKF
jgi:hypothetical protein